MGLLSLCVSRHSGTPKWSWVPGKTAGLNIYRFYLSKPLVGLALGPRPHAFGFKRLEGWPRKGGRGDLGRILEEKPSFEVDHSRVGSNFRISKKAPKFNVAFVFHQKHLETAEFEASRTVSEADLVRKILATWLGAKKWQNFLVIESSASENVPRRGEKTRQSLKMLAMLTWEWVQSPSRYPREYPA